MEKFCQKYLETGNATEAYRLAFDTKETSSRNSFKVNAYRYMKDPRVCARIVQLEELHLERHKVTIDRVFAEQAKLAFFDIRKIFKEDGNLKAVGEMDDATAAAIAGIEFEEIFERVDGKKTKIGMLAKIKMVDKRATLADLSKQLGMHTEKVELGGKDGGPLQVVISKDDAKL